MSTIANTSPNAAIESVRSAQQSSTRSQIAYTVAGKALDAQRAAGDAAIALIESTGRLGTADGKGALLDTTG